MRKGGAGDGRFAGGTTQRTQPGPAAGDPEPLPGGRQRRCWKWWRPFWPPCAGTATPNPCGSTGNLKPTSPPADLEATPEEIEAAYRGLDPQVLTALKAAAANIEKFHQAQREREMWAMEVQPGILAGQADPAPGPGGLLHSRRAGLLSLQRPDEHHSRQSGGGERNRRRHAPRAGDGGEPRHPGGGPPGRGQPPLQDRRPLGHRLPGLRHRTGPPGGQDRGAGQQVRHRGQAPGLRPGGHRLPRRAQRGPDPGG